MRKYLRIVPLCAVLVACGSSSHKLNSSQKAQLHSQQTQAEAQAQKVVQRCAAKANFITRAGRKAFVNCTAPPGHKAQFKSCAQNAVKANVVHPNEAKIERGVDNCVVKFR